MKKFFITISLFLSLNASAQIRWNQVYQQYFDQYKDIAIEQMLRYKIPASITLAQGVFESGAGRSSLAT
jgi:flagellum-specific peptidoglycan hydrolase FlgJ